MDELIKILCEKDDANQSVPENIYLSSLSVEQQNDNGNENLWDSIDNCLNENVTGEPNDQTNEHDNLEAILTNFPSDINFYHNGIGPNGMLLPSNELNFEYAESSKDPTVMLSSMDKGEQLLDGLLEIEKFPDELLESLGQSYPELYDIGESELKRQLELLESSGDVDLSDRFDNITTELNDQNCIEDRKPVEQVQLDQVIQLEDLVQHPSPEINDNIGEVSQNIDETVQDAIGKKSVKIKKFECPYPGCFTKFTRKDSLTVHTRGHTGEKRFRCKECGEAFIKPWQLSKHVKSNTCKQPHVHQSSGHKFISFKANNINFAKSTDSNNQRIAEQTFACVWPGCKEMFAQKSVLDLHLSTHLTERPDSSEGAGYGSMMSINVNNNLQSSINFQLKRRYMCPWPGCNLSFFFKWQLTEHEEHPHENKVETTSGNELAAEGDGQVVQPNLVQHSVDVGAEENVNEIQVQSAPTVAGGFKCNFTGCGKMYKLQRNLTTHIRLHTDENRKEDKKQIKCTWNGCDKSFRQTQSLTVHIRTYHTGELPFVCDFPGCSRRFLSKSPMVAHMRQIHKQFYYTNA